MNKILFIINTLKVGGAAKMLKYVANIASSVFDCVHIISMYDDSYYVQDIHLDIKVKFMGLSKVSRFKRQMIMIPQLKKIIDEENPNYVCAFGGHVSVMSKIATLRNKNIILLSAERGDPFTQPYLWRIATRWAYRNSDYCFFQLKGARDFFDNKTCNKSFIIPNPFIPSAVEPYDGYRSKTIISAGRFAPEKCFDILIKSFARVHDIYPEYRLILLGNGPLTNDYIKLVKQLGIEKFVFFPGYVESVSEAVQKEGIFVLSSLYEGIPNSMIEAMSVGIPCIATDCTPGGPRFLTDNGRRGILIPVKDEEAMTQALIYLINNPKEAREYGQKALEIISQLQEPRINQMWVSAFKEILEH